MLCVMEPRSITAPLLPNTHPQQIRAAIRTVAAGQSLLFSGVLQTRGIGGAYRTLGACASGSAVYCQWEKQCRDRANSPSRRCYQKSREVYTQKVGRNGFCTEAIAIAAERGLIQTN